MGDLPAKYEWLGQQGSPRMIVEALKLYGTHEAPGAVNNPVIMEWADELGVDSTYTGDDVPWCGLFMGVVAKRAGKAVPPGPLWALNWAKFGAPSPEASLGDVLVFKRNGGGHVALYVAEGEHTYHCLGGNQSDSVSITEIAKERLYAVRRPLYINKPLNVRPIHMDSTGKVSVNEA